MLFVVQGVVSIKKSVLFIQVVGSAQPSLVGHGPVLGRSDPSHHPRPEQKRGRDHPR